MDMSLGLGEMSYFKKVEAISHEYTALLTERKKREDAGLLDEGIGHTSVCNRKPILYVENNPESIAEEYTKLQAENERIRGCVEQVLADAHWSRIRRAYMISKETLGTATSVLENIMIGREFVKKSLSDDVENTELTKAYRSAYRDYNVSYIALQELIGKISKPYIGKKYSFSSDTKKDILKKVS